MSVKFTSRIKGWSEKTAKQLDVSMLNLATVIHRDAGNLAPVDTGALVASGRVERHGEGDYSIIFGGGEVPYAKRRHWQNRRNPQTLHYLLRAGDANSRSFKQYVKRYL